MPALQKKGVKAAAKLAYGDKLPWLGTAENCEKRLPSGMKSRQADLTVFLISNQAGICTSRPSFPCNNWKRHAP